MGIFFNLLVVLHFIGLAALIGGWMVQMSSSERVINKAMFHGALTQLVTGVLLVGLSYPLHDSDPAEYDLPDNAKITVKLVILLVILGLILVNRKKPQISNAVWGVIGLLAIANVVIAVFW